MTRNGKRVLVTGGNSGIGQAIARALVREGAHTWILGLGTESMDAEIAHLRSLAVDPAQRIGGVEVDIGDRAAVEAAVAPVLDGLGGIDELIHCAGIAVVRYLQDTTPADYERVMRVNFLGTVWVTRAFAPGLIAQGGGRISCISSTLGELGVFGYTAYAPSKFAVVGYCEALRHDLLAFGVTVQVVLPPDVDTPMLRANLPNKPPETTVIASAGGLMTPDEAAVAILRGIDSGRFRVVIGPMNKAALWLNRIAPALVRAYTDRQLWQYWRAHGKPVVPG